MIAIQIEFDQAQLVEAADLLEHVHDGVTKAARGAIYDTTKQLLTRISSRIRDKVAIKKKDIDPFIHASYPTPNHLYSTVTLEESDRLTLKYFGARQTKKGVTYRISKEGGRTRISDAFGPLIARLGNQVFRRQGKERLPLTKKPLAGVSPWGAFVRNDLRGETEAFAADKLENNLSRRVRFLLLKQSGAIA